MKKVRTTDKRNPNAPRDLIRDPFTPEELAALADAAKPSRKADGKKHA